MTQRHGVRLNWLGDDHIYVAQTIKPTFPISTLQGLP